MTRTLESFLISSLRTCGISPYSDFTQVDTLSEKRNYLGFYSIKNSAYSDKVYSFDKTSYGIELSGQTEIKLFGKRNGYQDHSLFNNIIDSLLEVLLTSDEILITNLRCSQIGMNTALGRLEINISFDIKILMTDLYQEVQN